MRYMFRPLPTWTDAVTRRRKPVPFQVTWDKVSKELQREAELLKASSLVIQVVTQEADLRQDGMLRTRAVVRHPGAVVSLDTPAGPLRFATDKYEQNYYGGLTSWQANVRAISLGLEALRAVDRYGITRRAEQYAGWLAIEAPPSPMTVVEARTLIDYYGGVKAALRATHPDRGGDRTKFERVQEARRVLDL